VLFVTVPVFLFPRAFLLLFLLLMLLIPVSSDDCMSQASIQTNLLAFVAFMMLVSGITAREKRSACSNSSPDLSRRQ